MYSATLLFSTFASTNTAESTAVTAAELIDAIVTEKGVILNPAENGVRGLQA